jgi:hypothetical protein
MSTFTLIRNGKREWKDYDPYVEEMLSRYCLQLPDCYDFFVGVFKGELGLVAGDFTSYLGVFGSSYSESLVLGGKVSVFPFEGHSWVVKHGEYERVVEDMRDIFDLIREAWAFYG